ncbi:MAG: hypothetical protein IJ867_00910 [Clostridia bacterium]|nr:hypothetical protein [Clostridia bacterium]
MKLDWNWELRYAHRPRLQVWMYEDENCSWKPINKTIHNIGGRHTVSRTVDFKQDGTSRRYRLPSSFRFPPFRWIMNLALFCLRFKKPEY